MKVRCLALGLALASVGAVSMGAATAAASSANSADSHIRRSNNLPALAVQNLEIQNAIPMTLTAGSYQQAIDHFGALSGQTFAQRYWVENSYASGPNAPVLYHICGEGDATQGYFLNDNAIPWAKALGARIVYLEHRYYGTSLPFSDLSTDHLQYLTLGNVIEDLAGFQKWIAASQGWTGPWITLGGSYSGTLSALYRQAHPELIVGALASSAPMISGVGNPTGTQSDAADISNVDPSSDTGDRQWAYQACTTFGFWQAEGADISAGLDLPSPWLCSQAFGSAPLVNYNTYNQDYDLPFIWDNASAPSKILFTYGSQDVWTKIGLAQQTVANPGITVSMIAGAGHHFDLNAPTSGDSAAVIAARNEFLTLAKQWIGAGP